MEQHKLGHVGKPGHFFEQTSRGTTMNVPFRGLGKGPLAVQLPCALIAHAYYTNSLNPS